MKYSLPQGPASPVSDTTLIQELLLVGSEAEMLELLEEILREAGFHVRVVDVLEDISIHVSRLHEPVVVCDEVVGECDGEAIFRDVRAAPNGHDAGFLLLGEDADGGRIRRCLDAGIDEFMLKPFDVEELIARIAKVFRLQELKRRSTTRSTDSEEIGFAGNLEFLGLSDLLMNLSQNMRSGRLELSVLDGDYLFDFKDGSLSRVRGPRGLKSRKAFFRAMRENSGRFRFLVTDEIPSPRGKFDNLANLILQAVQEADEFPLYRNKLPPDPVPVGLTSKVEDIQLDRGNAIQPLLEGLLTSTTIDILIHACPRTDLTAARELQELMEDDVLVVVKSKDMASQAP